MNRQSSQPQSETATVQTRAYVLSVAAPLSKQERLKDMKFGMLLKLATAALLASAL